MGGVPVSSADALVAPSPLTYDFVLANPPFGKKSSMSFTNEKGEEEGDDLTYNVRCEHAFAQVVGDDHCDRAA